MTRLRHRPRETRKPPSGQSRPIATCPECGKQAYTSKGSAKRAAEALYPGRKIRVYTCHRDPRWWHLTSQDAARTAEMRDLRAGQEDR